MHGPAALLMAHARSTQPNGFRQERRIETYRVLGRTIAGTGSGLRMDEDFPLAVKKAGGLVLRRFSKQFDKHEIYAIIFKDAMLVKNDPEWIAKQDFSSFGADAERMRRSAVEEAKRSEGGIHFSAKGTGIPVLEDKGGNLIFLSGDEIRTGKGLEYTFEKSNVQLNPQNKEQFRDGARALREGDVSAMERLRKAGGAHSQTRDKSVKATAEFKLLDMATGEEMGAAARNSELGHVVQVTPGEIFVPESVLIDRFVADAALFQPVRTERAPWEVFYIVPNGPDDDPDRRFAMKVYSVCGITRAPQEDARETERQTGNLRQFVSQTAVFDAFPRETHAGEDVRKPSLAQHPDAMIFDGFAPLKPEAPCVFRSSQGMRTPRKKRKPASEAPRQMVTRASFERHAIVPKAETIIAAPKEAVPKAGEPKGGTCMPRMQERLVEGSRKESKDGPASSPPRTPGRRRRRRKERVMERRPAARIPEHQRRGKNLEKKGWKEISKRGGKPRNPKLPTLGSQKSRMPKQTSQKPGASKEKKDARSGKYDKARTNALAKRIKPESKHMAENKRPSTREAKTERAHPKAKSVNERRMPKKTKKNGRALRELLPAFTSRRARAAGSSGRRRA